MNQINDNVIVGFGEALWDMLPDGKQIGGAPANFAYHATQCGLNGWVVSAIGEDALGLEIVENFQAKGLDFILDTVEYPTGTVVVSLNGEGMPIYEIKESVAWDNIPLTPELLELAGRTRAVCFGSLAQRCPVSRKALHAFLNAMPQDESRFRVFDINLRQNFYGREVIQESLERCNVLKINDEELVRISRMFDYAGTDLKKKCWRILEEYDLKMLVLTCGVNGSYVFADGEVSFLPTPKIDVVDTVGAGDSFSATFVSSIINGCSIPQAHMNAVEVSAFVCTQQGAMPTLPPALLAAVRG